MNLLTEDFLSKYADAPEHMNELGSFVFYRTYSRWLPNKGRRETWKEAVARAVDYNVSISLDQFKLNHYEIPFDKIQNEAETLFDNIFNLRQFLSGRTHWIGGAETGVANKFPLANFNCAFIDVVSWDDLCDLFYLLLVGTGVGFRGTKENIAKLPPIRTDYELLHSPYKPVKKEERLEHTNITILENGYAKILIGDSKAGWEEALRWYLKIITENKFKNIHHIKISYNSIRPKGERLITFGGTASGHEPMLEMFEGFDKVIKGTLDTTLEPIIDGHVRPIHIVDMGNLIGNNVVVGGVRRTAEIFICDDDDFEVINAKCNINTRTDIHHRRMSNNSIAFETKPTREKLHEIFEAIKSDGEPAFLNMEQAKKRRPNARGFNPCGEVILDSYGVCNLTTINMMQFVKDNKTLDFQGLMQAQALSVRAGLRMTCLDLELPHWDIVQKRDRLIGCSLTGWQDAMDMIGYEPDQREQLLVVLSEIAHSEAIRYANVLRIPLPLLNTTVKPEGTLSQVAGGVSSGIHKSKASCYIRRIRINASDPLASLAKTLDWTIHPEVGTPDGEEPRTLVIDFPIKSGATTTQNDQSAVEQLETYFAFQDLYTDHNTSNTISVKPDEWSDVEQMIWDHWDEFCGVSFMAHDGGSYELAPYEEITEEQYNELKSKMKPFNPDLLIEYEQIGEETLEGADGCESGICPIR